MSNIIKYLQLTDKFMAAVLEGIYSAGGYEEDMKKVLEEGDLKMQIGLLVMNRVQIKENPSTRIAARYGYTVKEDVEPSQFRVGDLKFLDDLPEIEEYPTIGEARRWAMAHGASLGLVDGVYILEHQDEIPIPEEKKLHTSILLPGTLLYKGKSLPNDGWFSVAYLRYTGVLIPNEPPRWCLDFSHCWHPWVKHSRTYVPTLQ